MRNQTALIWDIKKYAIHDGPGIRTTVFFKGCPLACEWCCNPESQSLKRELTWIGERCLGCLKCLEACPAEAIGRDPAGRPLIDREGCDGCGECAAVCPGEALNLVGREMTVSEVLAEVHKDAVFYLRTGGGLTLSGGEPLAQAAFAAELLRRYKDSTGFSTAIETSGRADWPKLALVAQHTDLFLYDIKHLDPMTHNRLTGVGNELILANLRRLDQLGATIVIRFPVIPGFNDDEENLIATADLAVSLESVTRLDILPYHRLGEPKYARLDRKYSLLGTESMKSPPVEEIKRFFEGSGLEVRVGG